MPLPAVTCSAAVSVKPLEEHCQPTENHALVLVQQVVAPVEGRPQGLVAARGPARATDQHRENVVETLGQLAERQHPHLGRGQLDRQRQAVEPPAYLHDGQGVVVGKPERRKHQLGAVLEEPDRVGLREDGRCRRHASLRQRQRRHRPAALSVHAEDLSAGREDRHGVTGAEQLLGKIGHSGSQMLAIVQDDQRRAVAHVLRDCRRGVLARAVRHAEPARHHPGDEAGIVEWRELHPAHALGVGRAYSARDGKRQAGLPGSPRSGQGQQPAARQIVNHILQLALAAHQRGQPDRNPAGNQRRHESAPRLPRPAPTRAVKGIRATRKDGNNASLGAADMPGPLLWPESRSGDPRPGSSIGPGVTRHSALQACDGPDLRWRGVLDLATGPATSENLAPGRRAGSEDPRPLRPGGSAGRGWPMAGGRRCRRAWPHRDQRGGRPAAQHRRRRSTACRRWGADGVFPRPGMPGLRPVTAQAGSVR